MKLLAEGKEQYKWIKLKPSFKRTEKNLDRYKTALDSPQLLEDINTCREQIRQGEVDEEGKTLKTSCLNLLKLC